MESEWFPILIGLLALAFFALVVAVIVRKAPVERAYHRRRANLCETCGYDLRASNGSCPECNTPIPLRRRDLIEQGKYIIAADVICIWCGTDLCGDIAIGRCQACKQSNPMSIRYHIAKLLNVEFAQVNLIYRAVREEAWRSKMSSRSSQGRITARDSCLGVRDLAVRIAGATEDAQRLLLKIGITDSAAIGRVVRALVQHQLFKSESNDRFDDFDGLFNLNELMKIAAAPEPKST